MDSTTLLELVRSLRKGAHRIDWSTKDIKYLRDNAGVLPMREIYKHLKRSKNSVDWMSRHLGVSLRCFKTKLKWCPVCAKWRSTVSPKTGQCRVCSKRKNLMDGEWRVSDALMQLTPEQRLIYDDEESSRGKRRVPPKPTKIKVSPKNRYKYAKEEERYTIALEAWEIKCLDLDIDANKTRLKRIRKKLGTNPRINS